MSNVIKIARCPDGKLIAALKKVKGKYPSFGPLSGEASGGVSLGAWDLSSPPSNEIWERIVSADGEIIKHIGFHFGGFGVSYFRGGNTDKLDPYFDILQFNWHPNAGGPSDIDRFDIVELLSKELHPVVAGRGAGIDLDALGELHNSTLERLQSTAATVLEQTTTLAAQFQQQLNESRAQDAEALEGHRKALSDEYESRKRGLDEREGQLNARLKEIDFRDNTTARRGIRDKMLEDVQNRIQSFGLTPETQHKRNPVRFAIIFIISVLVLLLANTAWELYENSQIKNNLVSKLASSSSSQPGAESDEVIKGRLAVLAASADPYEKYWLWLRVTFLTLALLGTSFYYIRWENGWAERHIEAELHLQQFHLDVNRVNWVLESCLEWRQATNNSAIPAELISSMTRNLFADLKKDAEQVIHPADELASAILGSASKLTINAGGNQIEIDRPGKKIPKERPV